MKAILTFVFAIFILLSCKKEPKFSDVPEISFKEFQRKFVDGFDDSLKLVIHFKDGDGDIGLESEDTTGVFDKTGPYYNNFIYEYHKKTNGVFVKDTTLQPTAYRLPDITPQGIHRSLEGDILINMSLSPLAENDTIRYQLFIYDRQLHKSNVITTPEIIINTHF